MIWKNWPYNSPGANADSVPLLRDFAFAADSFGGALNPRFASLRQVSFDR